LGNVHVYEDFCFEKAGIARESGEGLEVHNATHLVENLSELGSSFNCTELDLCPTETGFGDDGKFNLRAIFSNP
jgi:hypothetical protein